MSLGTLDGKAQPKECQLGARQLGARQPREHQRREIRDPSAVILQAHRPRLRLLDMRVPAVFLVALTVGCSATVEDEIPADEADASVQGAVVVDQVVTGNGAKTRVSARFVRVSGGIDQTAAEEVIGAPRFDVGTPLGCSLIEGEEPVSTTSGGSIELLDAGELVLYHTAGLSAVSESVVVPLAARAFPDVGELVSGIVYTSREGDTAIPSGGRFVIETSGSAQLDGFTVQVDAPEALSAVAISDLVITGDDLPVAWNPGHPSLGDRIYIDLTPDDGRTLRCVFYDDGEALIPAALVSARPGVAIDVEIHRHRRTIAPVSSLGEARALDGLEEAVVDFDYAVAAQVLVAEYTVP